MEPGMESHSVSYHQGAATATSTYASEQDLGVPQSSPPAQRKVVVPVLEGERCVHTSGAHPGVGQSTSIDVVKTVAVSEQDIPVAMVVGN